MSFAGLQCAIFKLNVSGSVFCMQGFSHRHFLYLKKILSAAENVPREVPDYSQFMAPKVGLMLLLRKGREHPLFAFYFFACLKLKRIFPWDNLSLSVSSFWFSTLGENVKGVEGGFSNRSTAVKHSVPKSWKKSHFNFMLQNETFCWSFKQCEKVDVLFRKVR